MEVNYNETKMPKFRFDRYQSTVVMPNLNYYVPRNVPQNVSQDNMEDQIISLIQKNNKISTEKMAMILGVSSKTVKRRIKEMERVNYIGRGSNGHWEISEEG
ncbi:AsnC family protein [Anaerostipes caccae]|uniref:AsnC family protein n=1 Tax=Anaerostipes caccae TaxID=105841 RepID=UPI0039F5132E